MLFHLVAVVAGSVRKYSRTKTFWRVCDLSKLFGDSPFFLGPAELCRLLLTSRILNTVAFNLFSSHAFLRRDQNVSRKEFYRDASPAAESPNTTIKLSPHGLSNPSDCRVLHIILDLIQDLSRSTTRASKVCDCHTRML